MQAMVTLLRSPHTLSHAAEPTDYSVCCITRPKLLCREIDSMLADFFEAPYVKVSLAEA